MIVPILCECGHWQHAHAGGDGPCRSCTLGSEGDCKAFHSASVSITVRIGKQGITRHVDYTVLAQTYDPAQALRDEIAWAVEALTERLGLGKS